ncbi:MAG TPA: hypothetical protein VFV78_05165 [Vicinamibacterales bacterium]|nr:hypothetical protein [Vicinamibacterales bacterium]
MRIEITSTLTQDDENRMAAAVLKALSGLLDMLPIAYMVRVETTDEHVLQHMNAQVATWDPVGGLTAEPPRPIIES